MPAVAERPETTPEPVAAAKLPPRRRSAGVPAVEDQKRAFLRLVSHELRTPLNSILGFSEILSAELFGPLGAPQYKEYAEIIRGSIESIHVGQWDAARALGLSPWRVLRLVILPQAMKPMLAPYVNQSVTQLKNTSLVSVIAVPDLVYNATLINADTYRPLEVYTIVALIYFAILFPATLVARRFERGLSYDKA